MPTHIFGSSAYTPQRNPPPRNKGLLTIGFPFSEGLRKNPLIILCLSFPTFGPGKKICGKTLRTMTFRVLHVQPRPRCTASESLALGFDQQHLRFQGIEILQIAKWKCGLRTQFHPEKSPEIFSRFITSQWKLRAT